MDTQPGHDNSPDFLQGYVNALRTGQAIGRQGAAPAPATPLPGLDPAARAQAARRAQILAAVATGLGQFPYSQRRAILGHLTPALATQGLDPKAVAAFDPTDANLEAHTRTATSLAAALGAPPEQASPADTSTEIPPS